MQDAPDRETLLAELARFLGEQVVPALRDPGLAFRVRVAAFLAEVVARECAHEEDHDAAELERLCALLGESGEQPEGRTARREAINALDARLVTALRAEPPAIDLDTTRAALMAILRDRLAVVQPRFDPSIDLGEGEP
ncbi:MAG: hypothetical protein KC620_13500 [Myxococcales bacterium]|nr:hypothetical protein [Myxococcales bacterium]